MMIMCNSVCVCVCVCARLVQNLLWLDDDAFDEPEVL